jgi:hypothetical protein
MSNYIEFAGEEPESLLPNPKDGSVPINMQQAEELLLESAKSDVQTFMAQWQRSIASGDANYPAELTADGWYQQFYAWMGV